LRIVKAKTKTSTQDQDQDQDSGSQDQDYFLSSRWLETKDYTTGVYCHIIVLMHLFVEMSDKIVIS